MEGPRVAVIGAGIMGLPTAVLLTGLPCKPKVTLIADKFSPYVTSNKPAAIVWPADYCNIGSADARRMEWTRLTFQYLYDLFASPLAGELDISLLTTYEVYDGDREDPWWKDYVLGFRNVGEEEMKTLRYPSDRKCWAYTTLMMPCRHFLSWQLEKLKASGGVVIQKKLESLREIDGDYDIIVNCAGLGSRQLVNDPQIDSIRGQIITVKAPWVMHAFIYQKEGDPIIYVLPRAEDVLLGGSTHIGDWDEQVDPVVSKGIMERCCKYLPGLSTAPVLTEEVGFRPGRRTVRLEVDDTLTKYSTVIHNYGHGGQGVTFFRGCTLEVAKLAEDCLMRKGFISIRSSL